MDRSLGCWTAFLESHHPSRRKTVSYVQSSAAADSVVCFGSPRLKAVSFWGAYRTVNARARARTCAVRLTSLCAYLQTTAPAAVA